MKLIVGLGNPGSTYQNTRHNLGFMVLDHIADHLEQKFSAEAKFNSEVARATIDDQALVLAKPQTMMNLSGQAVQKLAQFYKIAPTDVWIVHDDLDLEFGKLRIRRGGSSGGHNGLKSIIEQLGDNCARFKIGIANPQLRAQIEPEDFVLQRFTPEESRHLDLIIRETAEQVAVRLTATQIEDQTYQLI